MAPRKNIGAPSQATRLSSTAAPLHGPQGRKQELITISTAEAEYVAATGTHAAKEALWLCKLIGWLFPSLLLPIILYRDNQPALKLAQDDSYRARTKHIDLRYHFIQQVVANGVS